MDNSVKNRKWPKVFLFGDSITQQSFSQEGCWGAMLSDHLVRRSDVINRGFSGYNVRFCRVMLPSLLDRQTATDTVALTIFLGANDSNDPGLNPHQHCPLGEYRQGLRDMVEFAMSQGLSREKIILITPPAVYAPDWMAECKKDGKIAAHDNKVRGTYAKACLEVAQELGTKSVDIYSEMMKAEEYQKYLRDGLHFSTEGSQLFFSLLRPVIDDLTSHLPELLFPKWDMIDQSNMKESLLDF